jgi:hypothetical protein
MILSKREQFIIAATVIVVAAVVLYNYVLTPLLDCCDEVAAQKQMKLAEMERGRELLDRRRQIAPKWNEMTASGLKRDPAEAVSQILHAVQDWSKEAGLKLASVKPERLPEKKTLQEIAFQATGTGSMNAVSRFLWRLETAKVPIRVKELQLGTRKEGADDLTLQLRLSTLYIAPPPPASAGAAAPAGSTGESE